MCLERTTNQTGAKMIDNFYKAFEDKFRGSRELILQRLKVYIPFLKIIHTIYPHSIVIDLGCGRGEWLEFTGEFGFKSHGIDMDVGMLENAKSFGLSAELGDAVEYLKTLSDESDFYLKKVVEYEITDTDCWFKKAKLAMFQRRDSNNKLQ